MSKRPTDVVLKISKLRLSGNVVPIQWFKTIRFPDRTNQESGEVEKRGKADLNAIMILSDIVYWYRPKEVRDEDTGQFIRYEKKFAADLLQRSYSAMAEMFGISKREATNASHRLRDLGVIGLEFRTITTKSGSKAPNVLYISLDVEILKGITFESDISHLGKGDRVPFQSDTNTESTTKITTHQDEVDFLNLQSDADFTGLFGTKEKPATPDVGFTVDDLRTEEGRAKAQGVVLSKRLAKVRGEPWLSYREGKYKDRDGINAVDLQRIDYIINQVTGMSCNSDKMWSRWSRDLVALYQESGGDFVLIKDSVIVGWDREVKYRPGQPSGFIGYIRKALAVRNQRRTGGQPRADGRVAKRKLVSVSDPGE